MTPVDWTGRVVLVTGGTRGIGLETALHFARAGALPVLTYRWGGSEDDARARFAAEGLPAPRIERADAADPAQTDALCRALRRDHDRVDALVSNVAIAAQIRGLEDYRLRGLQRTVEYTAWPLVAYTLHLHEVFGAWPRYVVANSALGVQSLGLHYDFAGAAKAVLETLVRYLAYRLGPEGVRVNGVSSGPVQTQSAEALAGPDLARFVAWHEAAVGPVPYTRAEDVAGAIFALCSGWMDGLNGQIVTVDDGSFTFAGNRTGLFLAAQRRNPPDGESP